MIIESCTKEHIPVDCTSVFKDWKITSIDYPSKTYQTGICFPTKKVGYIIGAYGSIMKTEDEGGKWTLIHSGSWTKHITNSRLSSISFIDENIGYVGVDQNYELGDPNFGSGAALLKTTDGGITWSGKIFKEFLDFDDIKFTSEMVGLAIVLKYVDFHPRKVLMSTNDGGNKWIEIPMPVNVYDFFKLIDSKIYTGVIASDENYAGFIYRTKDNGTTWETKWLPGSGRNLYFINENIGFCGDGVYDDLDYKKFKTTDGGNTWKSIPIPFGVFSVMHFKNVNEGFIVNTVFEFGPPSGGELNEVISSYEVSQTHDGGLNWTKSIIDKECDFTGYAQTRVNEAFYTVSNKDANGNGKIYKFEPK